MVPPLGTFLRRFLKEFLKKTSSLGRSTVASLSWISFEEGFRFFSFGFIFYESFNSDHFFLFRNTLHGTQLLVEPTPLYALKSLYVTV